MGLVSLYLYCQDASTDIQHDLLGLTFDLDLRSNIEMTFQGHHVNGSTCIDARNTLAPELSR